MRSNLRAIFAAFLAAFFMVSSVGQFADAQVRRPTPGFKSGLRNFGTAGGGGGPCSYGAEACALFARMTVQPNTTRMGLIDTLISCRKTAGTWQLDDTFYSFAAHDRQAARLNWITGTYGNVTEVGTLTWAPDLGFTGTADPATGAGSAYLNDNFNPTTQGSQCSGAPCWQRNSAHVYLYSRTISAAGGAWDYGSVSTANTRINLRSTSASVFRATGPNDATTVNYTSTDSSGPHLLNRTSSTLITAYRAGVAAGTNSTVSTAVVSTNASYLGDVASSLFSARQFAQGGRGAGYTATQAADDSACNITFLTAIGAN